MKFHLQSAKIARLRNVDEHVEKQRRRCPQRQKAAKLAGATQRDGKAISKCQDIKQQQEQCPRQPQFFGISKPSTFSNFFENS